MKKTLRQKSSANLHIERESAGYIEGKTKDERKARITKIWNHIQSQVDHFRAPGHHPVSSPRLIKSSKLTKCRSELHIDHKPGRHILYLDTLDLAFYQAQIQLRLEIKQKQRKGVLKEEFAEVTVKIGNKAQGRVEEAVRVNLDGWKKRGFTKALYAGIEADIKRVKREGGAEELQKIRRKFAHLKKALKLALQQATDQKLAALSPSPLIHLNRDTIEGEYSPCDHDKTILEIKTDDVEWETVLGDTGQYSQIEIEHIQGNQKFFKRELDSFIQRSDFGIAATNDSKEKAGMDALKKVLIPKDDTPAELERVLTNRDILARYLKPCEFTTLDAAEVGIVPRPERGPLLLVA